MCFAQAPGQVNLFLGANEQGDRFCKILQRTMAANTEELAQEGISPRIGTRSVLRGAATHATSESTMGPAMPAVFRRTGGTLPQWCSQLRYVCATRLPATSSWATNCGRASM